MNDVPNFFAERRVSRIPRCEVTLLPNSTEDLPFKIIVYNRSAVDLLKNNAELLAHTSRRYPSHHIDRYSLKDLIEVEPRSYHIFPKE